MNHQLYNMNQLLTLEERDRELEELWSELEDVAFDEDDDGKLVLVDRWLHFPAGTVREDIWEWFDQRYSRGVYHLLYQTGGVDRTDEIAKLAYLQSLCFDCETTDCAYNNDGMCRFSLVNERGPRITEDSGCCEGCVDLFKRYRNWEAD